MLSNRFLFLQTILILGTLCLADDEILRKCDMRSNQWINEGMFVMNLNDSRVTDEQPSLTVLFYWHTQQNPCICKLCRYLLVVFHDNKHNIK